jgi:tetratricopeptide (TPR) repeat protein
VSSENLEAVQAEFQAGKVAFERGEYRKSVQHLEAAIAQTEPSSRLGGEVQIWLVTAYEAAGQEAEALDLCRYLSRHPDITTRTQGKRLLYILEAPKLKTRPEWLTQIPDLTRLPESSASDRKGTMSTASRSPRPVDSGFSPVLPPPDPEQVNLKDNQFVWVALGVSGLILGSLWWLSQG